MKDVCRNNNNNDDFLNMSAHQVEMDTIQKVIREERDEE